MTFRAKLARLLWGDRRFVLSLYRILLRRDPDRAGFEGWLSYLWTNPARREDVIEAFLGSDEFRARWGIDIRHRSGGDATKGRVRAVANEYHELLSRRELAAFLANGGFLDFEAGSSPDVSVVLVHYGNIGLTYATVASLRASTRLGVELIVVDNDGGLQLDSLAARFAGAVLLSPAENLGFVRGANAGAARATAEHVLFLNNDVRVQPGAVESALGTLREERAGAVVGRLIHFHDRLQEAGAFVWQDGSTEAYGRGSDPDSGEYRFRRDVDYGSGAFFLTPRALFAEVGGFDEAFSPGYYEDVDYCFRLRDRGFRVVYEPESVVWHMEGGSFSADTSREVTLRNRSLFATRHAAALKQRPQADAGNRLANRMSVRREPWAVVVDDRAPDPQFGAGHGRMLELVLALRDQGFRVSLFGTEAATTDWRRAARYLPADVELIGDRGAGRLGCFLSERLPHADLVVASRHNNVESLLQFLGEHEEFRALPVLFDMESMAAEREALRNAIQGTLGHGSDQPRGSEAEIGLARRADAVLVASDRDLETLRLAGVDTAFVVRHVVRAAPSPPPRDGRKGLLFVGAFHAYDTPNSDSMAWFAAEILPRLRRVVASPPTLTVAGYLRPGVRLAWASEEGVRFLGRQDDLSLLYDASLVFVAPTRFAGGIPIKVLEAAAQGLPVVVTDILARQLGWVPDRDVVVGPSDDPEGFSRALLRLLEDESLWTAVQAGGLQRVRRDASQESFRESLLAAVRSAKERAASRAPGRATNAGGGRA